jgi:hypothetical protein
MKDDQQKPLHELLANDPRPVNVKLIYVPPEQYAQMKSSQPVAPAEPPPEVTTETSPRRRPASPSYHRRRCSVCKHPERKAIEEAFLQWRSATNIACEFQLPGCTAVYRHAHATGLFPRRSRNLRFALEHLIEDAERARPTAAGVVQAVRAYARINSAGRWVEPPTTHVIVSAPSPEAARTIASRPKPAPRGLPSPPQKALPARPKRASSRAPESPLPGSRRAQPNRYKMKNKN